MWPGLPNATFDPGWWRVQTLTPPAIEPVTLTEAKAWARVESDDDDSLITDLIQAARERVEADQKRALIWQTKAVYFQGFPGAGGFFNPIIRAMGPNPFWLPGGQGAIRLPYPPLQSVPSVQYLDVSSGVLTTIDPTQYVVATGDPGRVQPVFGTAWPIARPTIDAVVITFICGYGAAETNVPASTRIAMRMLIAASYENREAFLEGNLTVTPAYNRWITVEDWGSYS